jgi:copper chaperone
MSTQTFKVSGMTCRHCVGAVSNEIGRLPGVEEVTVDLTPDSESSVTVVSAAVLDVDAVRAAVDEAGYELVE